MTFNVTISDGDVIITSPCVIQGESNALLRMYDKLILEASKLENGIHTLEIETECE